MSFLKKYLKWISTLLVLTGILLTNLNIYPLNIYGGKLTTYRKLSEKVLIDLEKFLPKTKKGPWTHKKKLF